MCFSYKPATACIPFDEGMPLNESPWRMVGFCGPAATSWTNAADVCFDAQIGVFVANDIAAADVLRVCRELGLRVPETVAVIGVDDERNLCESAKPTLSSIAIDLEREGEAAMPRGHPLADRETMTTTVSGSGFRCSFHQPANHNPSPTIQSTGRQTMNADGPRGCG